MKKRRISANYVFTVKHEEPLKNGIVELDENGIILRVLDNPSNLELASTEFYNGVLVPGFVNAHSHLELSHLKNKLSKHTGLTGFIDELMAVRNNFSVSEKYEAQKKAIVDMFRAGIVAVGDISNGIDSLAIKRLDTSGLFFHNFIEVLGFNNSDAEFVMKKAIQLQQIFSEISSSSIVPHATYSVSYKLMKLIANWSKKNKGIISIHNQETLSEDSLIRNKSGELALFLSQRKNNLNDLIKAESSVDLIQKEIISHQKLLLVHNTFSSLTEISSLQKDNVYLVFCPNANLFIENTLPKIDEFANRFQNICLGTDSLASNGDLSILSEMKTIIEFFPKIQFNQMLKWATLNGARALNICDKYGSIEKGKSPSISLIQYFDFKNQTISAKSKIKRIV